MTLEEFMDVCELSLVVWVTDYGAPYSYRQPTEADFKRKIMRVVAAHQGAISIVLRKAE